MEVVFQKEYLQELYVSGKSSDKKHRYQPEIVRKYIRVLDLMMSLPDVNSLSKFNALNYEQLKGNKQGFSSVRVNDKYRVEFIEEVRDNERVATICNIIELSNNYK